MNKQTLRNVIFAGLFLVPFIPFLVSTSFFFPFITTKAFAWRIIVEIIFATWVLLALFDASYRPRRSLILYSVLGFLVIIGLADLFGQAPVKSFWSNFERMEGYITLLHLGMFFVVASSVFGEISWKRWWNTSLVASFFMVLFSVSQLLGLATINQGGVRVDGTLGNAIYLAVYMLFHIFIAILFMWREWKNVTLRWVYGLLIIMQVSILYFTATRGAILGLLGGILVMAVLNIRNRENHLVRKMSIGILVGLVILVGGFMTIKDTSFVKNSLVLGRFSSLSMEELKTQGRYFVWPMALKGVGERPILGWGQDNFNYVFQKHYSPEMYKLEPWFDRAHNIFLDWLIAGGILGLLAYLSLYLALLLAIWRPKESSGENEDGGDGFSYAEKSVLTGLIAAYFFHNIFVFDNLISYIFFFSILAYLNSRSDGKLLGGEEVIKNISVKTISWIAISILLILSLYFINVKPLSSNVYLINALKSIQIPGKSAEAGQYLEKAYNTSRLGRPEVVEQTVSNSVSILTGDISIEDKNTFFTFAKDAILKQNKDLPGDSRYELLAGSFFSTTGLLDQALTNLERAKELIPNKQQVYFETGAVYINQNEFNKALAEFKAAYELAPEYSEAKIIYLIGAIYAGDRAIENEITSKLTEREFIFDDRIINAYYTKGRTEMVKALLSERIKLDPEKADTYRQNIEELAN